MSNRPMKLRERGREIRLPTVEKPPSSGGGLWRQLALTACMLVLSAAYILGLNDPAAAVVARKRELPVYSVKREDKVISISFDASWGADKTIALLDILDKYNVEVIGTPIDAIERGEDRDIFKQTMAELGIEPRCCTPEERERRKKDGK